MRNTQRETDTAHDDVDDLLLEIKKALSNWHDLSALRRSTLADLVPRTYLLAAGRDHGLALRQLLHEAIESLKPWPHPGIASRAERSYHALRLRYIEKLSAHEVQKQLAIGHSELHYVQKKGLQAIAGFWQQATQLAPGSAHIEPIPRLASFVGREKELAFFRKSLAEKHLAVICGMPGMGKSSLGAELVADLDLERIVWIKFIPGRNTMLESLLEDFAQALAAHGQPEYLLFLQAERQKSRPLTLNSHVRYLVSLLAEKGFTICLDDYHLVNEDPLITSFGTDLWYRAMAGQLDLVVMSRTSQHFAREWDFPLLEGMSLEETRRLLAGEGLNPSGDTLAAVHARTAGSPMFLKLFAARAKGEKEAGFPERVARMEHTEEVHEYLLREVESMLTPDAIHVATYASALRTAFPLEDDGLIKLLANEGIADVQAATHMLMRNHLALLQANGALTIHPLVKAYFYARVRGQNGKREQVHQQLANYWERQGEWLEAAHHYMEARETEAAARLLAERIENIINAGQARAAMGLLKRLTENVEHGATSVEPCAGGQAMEHSRMSEVWCGAWLALGRLHTLFGEYAAAIRACTQSLCLHMGIEQQAQALRLLGDAYGKQSEYSKALSHYDEGIALLGDDSQSIEMGRLQHSAGQAYHLQGKHTQALDLCEKAAHSLLAAGYRAELAQVYNTLSAIHREQGNYAAAMQFARQSLMLTEQSGQVHRTAEALYNIAVIMHLQGHYTEALDHFDRALELARQVGDVNLVANIFNSLGIIHFRQERWAQAIHCLQETLGTKEKLGDQRGIGIALANLAHVYFRQADYTTAITHTTRALKEYNAADGSPGAANIALLTLAEIYYCQGRLDEALDFGRRGLASCREAGHLLSEASALELLGRLYLARGELSDALEYLLKAVEIGERMGASTLVETYLTLAETRLAMGEYSEAQHCAEIALDAAEHQGGQCWSGNARRVMGEVWGQEIGRQGDWEKAEEYLRKSVTLLEEAQTPFELGRAYRSLGLFLRQTGRVEEGRACLEKARETFERIGAKWELEKTNALATPRSTIVKI